MTLAMNHDDIQHGDTFTIIEDTMQTTEIVGEIRTS